MYLTRSCLSPYHHIGNFYNNKPKPNILARSFPRSRASWELSRNSSSIRYKPIFCVVCSFIGECGASVRDRRPDLEEKMSVLHLKDSHKAALSVVCSFYAYLTDNLHKPIHLGQQHSLSDWILIGLALDVSRLRTFSPSPEFVNERVVTQEKIICQSTESMLAEPHR